MRQCPNCGCVDPPEWRHMRWSYWIDFCTIEDFQKLHPDLAERLLKGEKLVEDKYNVYRISKKVVHRKAKVDYGPQFNIPMDHAKHKNPHDLRKYWQLPKGQTKFGEHESKQ